MIVGTATPVDVSVIVGLVNEPAYVCRLLEALAAQRTLHAFEVILADRTGGAASPLIASRFPEVQVLDAPAGTTLPELRTLALERARGRFVFVTEDHTVPPEHWIERFTSELDAAPARVIGVGGPVDNLMTEGSVDWAAFLCEYSAYLPPLSASDVGDVPGMNIAYRRSAFDGVPRELLTRGFWESTLHPRLLSAGHVFRRLPDVVIGHRKHFDFGYFLSQRYHYSRYYAGVRFEAHDVRRYAYAALSLALPPLILSRVVRNSLRRPRYVQPALRSVPALYCFAVAWGVGETVGYALGPGNSLREVE